MKVKRKCWLERWRKRTGMMDKISLTVDEVQTRIELSTRKKRKYIKFFYIPFMRKNDAKAFCQTFKMVSPDLEKIECIQNNFICLFEYRWIVRGLIAGTRPKLNKKGRRDRE